jgi:NADH-quinone oxidoreductase subunit N
MTHQIYALQSLTLGFDWSLLLPEIIVCVAAVVVMMVDAFSKPTQRAASGGVALAGLVGAAIATISLWNSSIGGDQSSFSGMIVLDRLRLSFTLIFLLVSALTILISMVWVETERLPAGEFHSLLLFATAGMMLMASGLDLVMIFLGLEILSIATYVMAGFRRSDLRSNESSLKYFILGSFSSAFLLYGIALVYGGSATPFLPGTTNIVKISQQLAAARYPSLIFVGAAMMLVGFGFKIATAPFHIWTPDVYEGAPTPVTAFMAAGPKAAGFAAFLRVFVFAFPFVVSTSATDAASVVIHSAWLNALVVLAIITMTVGNIAAIVQSNVKRMLAYSSIAHAGYALVGFIAAGASGDLDFRNRALSAVAFYLLTYAVMNLGAFAVVGLVARSGDRRTEFEDYNGIGFRAPILSFTLSLFMLSLFGMPLTAGFMGKIAVFSSALQQGYYTLVIIAVLNTALSAYYYLRLIVVMFFRDRTTSWTAPPIPLATSIALIIAVLGVLYLGIFPGRVMDAFQEKQLQPVTASSQR